MEYNHGEWVLGMKYDFVGVTSRDNVRDEIIRRGDSSGVSKKNRCQSVTKVIFQYIDTMKECDRSSIEG